MKSFRETDSAPHSSLQMLKTLAQIVTIGLILYSTFEFARDPGTQLRKVYARLYYSIFVPQTYFVRNDGSQSCNGLVDAPYPGTGTGVPCAFSNLQHGLNSLTYGDTLKLKAGHTFTRGGGIFASFILANKGTPPTGTDADYITITTTDTSGTPAALSGYPAARTRITTAMAANMPHVRIDASTPAFGFNAGAKYWKIERLDISNTPIGHQCIRLIGTGDGVEINSRAAVLDRITIQLNWIHPIEEDGTVLTSANDDRTAENAIYLDATNVVIQNNAIQGFVGHNKFGNEAGRRMTSAGILVATYGENFVIQNNLIEAWTYAWLSGGSSMPSWTVTQGGSVVSCSSPTSCTLSTTSGLQVGRPLAIRVASAATWGSAFVTGINGSEVALDRPVCHSFDGGNTCATLPGNPTPASGDLVRWGGIQPNNILFKRNIFAHYAEWAPLMEGDCGGKGYLEVKSCVNCVFDGNVFTGCTGPTVTARNQDGDFPWVSLDGLTFSNNLWENSDRIFTSFLRDSTPTAKSQNITWFNNLYLGVTGNVSAGQAGGELSAATTGGVNVTIRHNTIAWSKTNNPGSSFSGWKNFSNLLGIGNAGTMENFVFKDNIVAIGQNACFPVSGSASITDCWPGATVINNVFVNADNHSATDINNWWRTAFPVSPNANSYITGYGPVNFVNANSTMTLSGADYRLASSSPYKNAASDGSDIGYNHSLLVAALGYDPYTGGPAPSPSPTPSPSPSVTPIQPGSICRWSTTPPCRVP